MIPGSRLLLERRLVLLVNHDQAQVQGRSKHRTASTHDHIDFAPSNSLPVIMPLSITQMTVQHGHAVKTAAETTDCLRRQADFGDQHDRLATIRNHLADRLDVNLRLPAPRHSVQQQSPVRLVTQLTDDLVQRRLLIRVQCQILLADHAIGPIVRVARIQSTHLDFQQPLLRQTVDRRVPAPRCPSQLINPHRRSRRLQCVDHRPLLGRQLPHTQRKEPLSKILG